MNERETRKALKLVSRFFDGDTTPAEERRLYRLFRRRQLPPGLEVYRPVFAGFAAMQADGGRRALIVSAFRRAVCGTAAALVLALGIPACLDYHEERMLARVYGGSYVIENGQRIDDLGRIKGDIKAALDDAESIEARAGKGSIVEKVELDVLNSIDDPEMRKQVSDMLNE